MNWLQQKRKVTQLESEALSAALSQGQALQQTQEKIEASLRKPDVWAWSFSLGMLWELGRDSSQSKATGVRRQVSRLTRFTLFTMRVIGLKM